MFERKTKEAPAIGLRLRLEGTGGASNGPKKRVRFRQILGPPVVPFLTLFLVGRVPLLK